jgi:CRISPR/Cas system-associated endonuclease Cas3-HD
MQNQEQTDKLKKELEKISTVMQKVEEIARSEIKNQEDYLRVCGAILAVTRNMYMEVLGPFDTAKMFQAVADSFVIQEDIIQLFKNEKKPTIH